MANDCKFEMKVDCKFEMKVKATTEENLEKFTKILQYDDKESNLYRIFESSIYFDDPQDSLAANIYGTCAWSVHCCMCDGEGSFYDAAKERITSKSTTLKLLSKELHLEIEIFSKEPGMGFMEHYKFVNGEQTIDEVTDYCCLTPDDYSSRESAEEETGRHIDEEEWIEALDGGYIDVGGFDWNFSI